MYFGEQLRYRKVTGRFGGTMLTGDVERKGGVFADATYPLTDDLSLFASYQSQNYQKIVINQVILPAAGVDCSEVAVSNLLPEIACEGDVGENRGIVRLADDVVAALFPDDLDGLFFQTTHVGNVKGLEENKHSKIAPDFWP